MTKYNIGDTYKKGTIDVSKEIIPQNMAFKSHQGERHIFEEREGRVSYYQVTSALESGTITELDKTVISLVATFGSACVTTKVLKELLLMMGVSFTDKIFESSVKRLNRFHLINFSRFVIEGRAPSNMKIITLTKYGSQLAKSLGIVHRFNPIATASAEASSVKSRAETAQLICNYLKNHLVDSFKVRPVIVVEADNGAIIRPAATIVSGECQLFFEVPRRCDGWLEDLIDKLGRYELVFKGRDIPTVIINGEDEEMNLEAFQAISKNGFNLEILFTDDLAMFGERFRYSIYAFNNDNSKKYYEIMSIEDIA